MLMAIAVVKIKYTTTREPSLFNCSISSLAASPRITEAKTRGTTIIWIKVRKICPGSATQFLIISAVFLSTRLTGDPMINPAIMPAPKPMSTLSHKCPLTKEYR
jgi:hypothetical protein